MLSFVQRKRASTKSLLGTDYQDIPNDPPSFTGPPKSIKEYDDTRLKNSLGFVDQTLRNTRRKVSPIVNHLLTIYKLSVKDALETDDEQERELLLKSILGYERTISANILLRQLPNDNVSTDMVEKLSQLRRFEFAARYGDYMAYVCDNLKIQAKAEKTEHFEQLSGWKRRWTAIDEDIKRERRQWVKWGHEFGVEDDEVKTTLAVFSACNYMSLNFEKTIQTISLYAQRNELVHASIMTRVEQGLWHKLAETLALDMRDLPVVVPNDLVHAIPILQDIIQTMIDEYFTIKAGPLEYQAWRPKDSAYAKATELQASRTQHQDAAIKERKKIEMLAAARVKERVDKHSMVHLTAAVAGIPGPSGRLPKRPASTEDAKERREKFQRRAKAWDMIVGIQKQGLKALDEYTEGFGDLEAPVDPSFWDELQDDEASAE
ncbi:hypothetical protein G7046_g227 [Stylonectria norvegica]|nr:hypothetical protein G7046_g227 [Stylonectria norvegica]